ncbi:MAG: ArsA family ATPase [Solirubrobacteraceae bacterium]
MAALLDKRLIFVTGKGGVGKSTVATALGLLGARRGRRAIVAELSGREQIHRSFDPARAPGAGVQFEEVELAPGLFTISIDPQSAMEEYLRVKTGPLGQALGQTKLFQAFAMATPGMRELLSMGKCWELSQDERRTSGADPYDLVIVDAPASGHGLGFLRTPRTFADIAMVGPIAHQGRVIANTLADRRFTGVIAVSTAEEMPVNETLILHDALRDEGLALDAVIVNALYPQRFTGSEVHEISDAMARAQAPSVQGALRAALSEHSRALTQREQRARLAVLEPVALELPHLFTEDIGRFELEELADALERELERPGALAS